MSDDYEIQLQARIVALELMMRSVWTGMVGQAPQGALEENRQALASSIGRLNPENDDHKALVLAAALEFINQHFDAVADRARSAGVEP